MRFETRTRPERLDKLTFEKSRYGEKRDWKPKVVKEASFLVFLTFERFRRISVQYYKVSRRFSKKKHTFFSSCG